TREMQKNPENARKIAVSSENKSDEAIHCYVVATDWYDGRTGEYLDTTHAQTCEWQRGGSRSSSGGYSEGSYGGGGGTDGLGGTCSSCYDPPEVPEPNLTVKITLSIKANPRMNCITNKMSLNSFVKEIAKFTETEQDPANTTLKLGPLSGANGQMQPDGKGNYEITINSSQDGLNRPDLLIAKTILHELVHAEIQEALRKKGVTAWDNDFGRNFDTYVKLYKGNNDQHHSYMAEQLLGKMGAALMDIHKNQFPEDFAKLTAYMKSMGDYPKGIPVDFYMNICWQGLKETTAFSVMKKITTNPPILSPYEKYVRDISDAKKLTKPCGS
ncbi:hypothetical protein OU792_18530, partial [Algoriphagus sp. NF]|uniref:hypothetical protein n=1 Tax=Algoriphagus sp. NF TaxID=2992756 RepID=UPI00237B11FC